MKTRQLFRNTYFNAILFFDLIYFHLKTRIYSECIQNIKMQDCRLLNDLKLVKIYTNF